MVVMILGSKSDLNWSKQIGDYLDKFSIGYKIHIASAHKTPEYLLQLIKKYEKSGKKLLYICIAGRSNALGGFVDAQVLHPVINCPPPSEKYGGMDLLSSLRMPTGVSCMTVLEPDQAALAAAKILGAVDKISLYQKQIKEKIIRDDKELNKS